MCFWIAHQSKDWEFFFVANKLQPHHFDLLKPASNRYPKYLCNKYCPFLLQTYHSSIYSKGCRVAEKYFFLWKMCMSFVTKQIQHENNRLQMAHQKRCLSIPQGIASHRRELDKSGNYQSIQARGKGYLQSGRNRCNHSIKCYLRYRSGHKPDLKSLVHFTCSHAWTNFNIALR